jgi:hypothetical protein
MRRPLLLIVLALFAAAPARAVADPAITVTDFTLTTAAPDAGASVNASSSTSFSYSNTTEDVKKAIGHFAPGLLANPETVPHCPQAQYLADTCPADTLIGSAGGIIDTVPNLGVTTTVSGRIYNQELLGSEAGRLGIILDTPVNKTYLTAPFYVRSDGDFGLDGVLDDLPRALTQFGVGNTQIKQLSFTLFGTVNGRKFTRGPTNCSLHVSTGEASGYDDTTPVKGSATPSYTPTNCDKLPFGPTFAITVGSKDSNGEREHPSLRVHVTQKDGEAGIGSNSVTLPFEIGPNLAAFDVVCTTAQLAQNACPQGSQVGTTSATSSFVATPLTGAVYLVQQPGAVIPALVADLRGRVHVPITISNSIIGGRLIKSTVASVPDRAEGRRDVHRPERRDRRLEAGRARARLRPRRERVGAQGRLGDAGAPGQAEAAPRRREGRPLLGHAAEAAPPEPREGEADGEGACFGQARAQRGAGQGQADRDGQRPAEARRQLGVPAARRRRREAVEEGPAQGSPRAQGEALLQGRRGRRQGRKLQVPGDRPREEALAAAQTRTSRPPQTVSTTISLACTNVSGSAGIASKIQAVSSCSIAP